MKRIIYKCSQQGEMKMMYNQYLLPKLSPKKYYNNPFVKKSLCSKRYIALKANGKDEFQYENYQVFQHKNIHFKNNVTIRDVDDYLEAVYKLKKTDKDDYFMSHGLDYDRCYEYINIVKYLNRCWKMKHNHMKNENEIDNNKITDKHPFLIPGWTILGVIAFIYYFVKDDL